MLGPATTAEHVAARSLGLTNRKRLTGGCAECIVAGMTDSRAAGVAGAREDQHRSAVRALASGGFHDTSLPSADAVDLVVFQLGELRLAVRLEAVDHVLRAVEITPLPAAPPSIMGIIDVHGSIVPVFNVRARFLQQDRGIDPADCFVLAHTTRRNVALVADGVLGVVRRASGDLMIPKGGLPRGEHFEGILRLDDGLVLIYDLERFLSAEEERVLDEAMARRSDPSGPSAG